MVNFLLSPLEYAYNIYDIYVLCDTKSQKALFCSSKALKKLQEDYEKYFKIRPFCSLANKYINVLRSFLTVSINDEKTGLPFDFDFCRTIEEVQEQFAMIYPQLAKIKLDPYQELVACFVPVFLNVTFSPEVKDYQLDKIPAELVMHFKKCIDIENPQRQTQKLQNLAKILSRSNEKLVLILADLAQPKGYEGIVIIEYVNWLAACHQFERAWAVVEKLPDQALQERLFTFIAEAQIPQDQEMIPISYPPLNQSANQMSYPVDLPTVSTPPDEEEAADTRLIETCCDLIKQDRYEEAFQKACKITDPDEKDDWLTDIVTTLYNAGCIQRAFKIIELTPDLNLRFFIYIRLCKSIGINDERFNFLMGAALQIEDKGERLEAILSLLEIAQEHKNKSWYNMVYPLSIRLTNERIKDEQQQQLDEAMEMNPGPGRDELFGRICARLLNQGNWKEAFEYSDNIEDATRQAMIRLDICRLLKAHDKLKLMQQVLDSIQDPEILERAYHELFSRDFQNMETHFMSQEEEKDRELLCICHKLKEEHKYEEYLQHARKIINEIFRTEAIVDILDLNVLKNSQQLQEIIDLEPSPYGKFCFYKAIHSKAMDDDKFKALINLGQQVKDPGDRKCVIFFLKEMATNYQNASWLRLIDFVAGAFAGIKVKLTLQELIDKAMGMDEGVDRDNVLRKICTKLLEQGKWKEAFEYSDNIENIRLQSDFRRKICRLLSAHKKFELMKQVFNSIQDLSIKEETYAELVYTQNSPTSIPPVQQQRGFARRHDWYHAFNKVQQIPDIRFRDRMLEGLAKEAKRNQWDTEVNVAVEQIADPEIMASFF